jgi:hypothetical protein
MPLHDHHGRLIIISPCSDKRLLSAHSDKLGADTLIWNPVPGTRQYKMVCAGTSQYVPYSIQGRTRNLKMVHTSMYQHRQFLWQYILVCTGMYCLVPAQYKVVQGGTRWYKMVQGGTNNGIWRNMEVQGRTRIV